MTTINIAIVGRAITLERKPSKKKQRTDNKKKQRTDTKKKQRTDTKKVAKKIKSDNFTRCNKEKSNIAIAILEKVIIEWHHNYFVFWW